MNALAAKELTPDIPVSASLWEDIRDDKTLFGHLTHPLINNKSLIYMEMAEKGQSITRAAVTNPKDLANHYPQSGHQWPRVHSPKGATAQSTDTLLGTLPSGTQ